ncbi:MAG: cyclic nucleotide-binding domain-containing protein [Acidimicrobiales bacterium]
MPTPEEILAALPLFSMTPKRELGKLAREVHERRFDAGSVLTEQGEFGSVFTVIVEGRASIAVHGEAAGELGPGDYFGEMALIDRSPRAATITAETEVACMMLTQPVFRPFALSHPETMWALLELMVKRVREAEARNA